MFCSSGAGGNADVGAGLGGGTDDLCDPGPLTTWPWPWPLPEYELLVLVD